MKLLAPIAVIVAILCTMFLLDRRVQDAEFALVNADEIFTLDPQRMSWMQDFRMAYALYEPLVRWNNDDFTFEPAAASRSSVSDDGLTYTFTIRADAKWSNGAPVTAHDYIWSWSRAMLPDTAADYSMMFFHIAGAEAFFDWRAAALKRFASMDQSTPDHARALWRETEAAFARLVGLRAIDDHTIEVKLRQPTPYFLDLVAFGVFHPVYRPAVEGWIVDEATRAQMVSAGWHTVDRPSFDDCRFVSLDLSTGRIEQDHQWTKPGRLVSNGPYILTDWRYKRGMRLALNPYYHSPEKVRSRSVIITSIGDANTAVLAYERGSIDWLSDVSTDYQADLLAQRRRYLDRHADAIASLREAGLTTTEALGALPAPEEGERRDIHAFPTFGTDFWSFNCRPTLADGRVNPFADARVRRAFTAAVDRSMIVSRVTRLNEPVARTFIPHGSIPGYTSPEGLGFDPAYARGQLAEAGWVDRDGDGVLESASGERFPVVDLVYSTNTPRYRNIGLALREMWQQTLGVQVEMRGKENKAFKEDLKSGRFMIGRGVWYGDYGDPTTFLDLFRTDDGNNDRGYSNEWVDEMLDRAAREQDPARRMAILEEIEAFLFTEALPMITICQRVQLYMFDPSRVRGISTHPRLTQYLWELEVKAR